MSLAPGTRLGRFEILKALGAGGMGEVYRARDTRLDREVAIKILPESVAQDPVRLARFDREAKAVAALSHPNILALHDAGTEDGTTFAVMELLEGETLRDRISHGPIPLRRAVDIASQIARGLAAAHAKGLVHRDLKPANLFLLADGQVKILDFGLAKSADNGDGSAATATQAVMTEPGTVLGTVGYMAPEQVRGHAIDARTDLFALGAVLYEMLTGERAFRRETAAETMAAILHEEPPDLSAPLMAQAPALDRIVRHCLEKNPSERFQSARDVAFALEGLSGTTAAAGSSGPSNAIDPSTSPRAKVRSRPYALLAAIALVVIATAAWFTGYLHLGSATSAGAGLAEITYQRVTFDEGFVFAARFGPDPRTIVYSADWENQPRDIFVTSLDNSSARALGYKGADLLSVSAANGALAILVDSWIISPYNRRGTIARASLNLGAPHKELDRIQFADFAPDGSLAVTRQTEWKGPGSGSAIEWPQGRIFVDRTKDGESAALRNPRISPLGSHVAFFVCESPGGCSLTIADTEGKTVAKSPPHSSEWGLAWAPGGREVWFAVKNGGQCAVYALDLNGVQRLLLRTPGDLTVHDVSADGRMLASVDDVRSRLETRDSPTAQPRDLSWKEGGSMRDVSRNGTLLFDGTGISAGRGSVYVRRSGESEPLPISGGRAIGISDEGATALVLSRAPGNRDLRLSLVPTTGLAQILDVGPIESVSYGIFLKGGRLVLELSKPGEPPAVFVRPADGGPITQFFPPRIHMNQHSVAPDGQHIVGIDEAYYLQMCSVPSAGVATCARIPGATGKDFLAGWTADSASIVVYHPYPVPVEVERVNITTGRRDPLTMLQTASAAVSGIRGLFITSGGALFYNYDRHRSTLYVISGLK
jgi:Tol biopolymer transport system component